MVGKGSNRANHSGVGGPRIGSDSPEIAQGVARFQSEVPPENVKDGTEEYGIDPEDLDKEKVDGRTGGSRYGWWRRDE